MIGLVVACAALVLLSIRAQPADFDELIFLDVGAAIAHTGLPVRTYALPEPSMFFDHAPLWPYLMAALTASGNDPLWTGRTLALAAMLGALACVFFVVRRHAGSLAATVAALLVATSPVANLYAFSARMEPFMVLGICAALLALDRERWGLAGLALLLAVMSKEFALAFAGLAALYAWRRAGFRAALLVGVPGAVAFAAWIGYAAWMDADGLVGVMRRWADAATAGSGFAARTMGPMEWSDVLVMTALGPLLAIGLAFAVARWWTLPPPARLALVYAGVALGVSFAMALKEPRHLIAVPFAVALAVALALPRRTHDLEVVDRPRLEVALGSPPEPQGR